MRRFAIAAAVAVSMMMSWAGVSAEVREGIAVEIDAYKPMTAEKDKGGIIEMKCRSDASVFVGPDGDEAKGYTDRCYGTMKVFLHHALVDLSKAPTADDLANKTRPIAWDDETRWWKDESGIEIHEKDRGTCVENAGKTVSQYTWFPLRRVTVVDTGGWLELVVNDDGQCWELR